VYAASLVRVFDALETFGVILSADPALPSIATLVAGEPIRGSWWGHPRGNDIYEAHHSVRARPDVVDAKLISGKVTFIHRRLWPALYAVAVAREPWQTEGLSDAAHELLEMVTKLGQLRTDEAPRTGGDNPGDAARELEGRVLLHGADVHTQTGAHAKVLQTWEQWAQSAGFVPGAMTAGDGKAQLEAVVATLNARFQGTGRLAWQNS